MNKEREIGRVGAQMITSALRRAAKGAGLEGLSNEARGKERMRFSQRMEGGKQAYLRGIAIVMQRYGFIQHYGIEAGRVRRGGERVRRKPRETSYRFSAHLYKRGMQGTKFLEQVVEQSGAVAYLSEAIAQERGEEIALGVKQILISDK